MKCQRKWELENIMFELKINWMMLWEATKNGCSGWLFSICCQGPQNFQGYDLVKQEPYNYSFFWIGKEKGIIVYSFKNMYLMWSLWLSWMVHNLHCMGI